MEDFIPTGGIVCMSLAIVLFVLVKIGAAEAVKYRGSKKVLARVVEAREVPFTVSGSSKEQYRYEMTVEYDLDGKVHQADGFIEKPQYTEHAFNPGGEVECYYLPETPEKVIFYDPISYAKKGDRNYKIAFAMLIIGAAMFLAGKFL